MFRRVQVQVQIRYRAGWMNKLEVNVKKQRAAQEKVRKLREFKQTHIVSY